MITIIIPTFNELENLKRLIPYLLRHIKSSSIIISDGGSNDGTCEYGEMMNIKVIRGPKGRAVQMNRGAREARGTILYFLHADSFPPTSFEDDIINAYSVGYNAGSFRMAFDNNHPFLKFYSFFTRFPFTFLRFGDQSLFMDKALFEDLKGFDEKRIILEDQELVRHIKRRESLTVIANVLTTSSRKYLEYGIIKTQLIYVLTFLHYRLGFSEDRNYRFFLKLFRS